MDSVTNSTYKPVAEQQPSSITPASSELYGEPYAACMAMMMQASGITKLLPDIQHVSTFTRSDGSTPATTALGAACSFMDSGFDVTFAGPLDADSVLKRPDEMAAWRDRFDGGNRAYSFSLKSPTSREIAALVGPGLKFPWLTMLYVDSAALGAEAGGVQPVVIESMSPNARTLVVHDPGSVSREATTSRTLDIAQALGGKALNRRVSLLAVRRRRVDSDFVRMTTPAVVGATYN